MANVRNANTFFIDTVTDGLGAGSTATDLPIRNIKVLRITVTPDGGSARIVLKDFTTTDPKIDIAVPSTESSQHYDFGEGIVFPTGIKPDTVTTCKVTCLIQETRR